MSDIILYPCLFLFCQRLSVVNLTFKLGFVFILDDSIKIIREILRQKTAIFEFYPTLYSWVITYFMGLLRVISLYAVCGTKQYTLTSWKDGREKIIKILVKFSLILSKFRFQYLLFYLITISILNTEFVFAECRWLYYANIRLADTGSKRWIEI